MTEIAANLAVFDEAKALMKNMDAINATLVFAYEDKQGERDARSHIAKLRKIKTSIAAAHKLGKAEALTLGRVMDGMKNELTEQVDRWIKVHKDPLDAIAAEKQALIDAEEAKAAAEEEKRLADIEAREAALKEAEDKLAREKAEVEQKEREKQIAAEAAETAKVQAEAKAKAEADAKELAVKNAKEAEEAKEQKRVANKKHRKEVEDEIHYSLTEHGLDEDEANGILEALKNNSIKHVSINY